MILKFKDRFSGSRYGKRTPIGIARGTELYEKFVLSPRWKQLSREEHIEEKNDNRTDIYRGSTTVFEDVRNGKRVTINRACSNTQKTVHWVFSDQEQSKRS